MNLFYFHVPKTAGSSINEFFSQFVRPNKVHIENVERLDEEFCSKFKFLSGHVPYSRMNNLIDLSRWTTIITLREPLSYTISHLKWLRRLAEPGLEDWKSLHPQKFQHAAQKIASLDLSNPEQITQFIQWLSQNQFFYFHNTQLFYLNRTPHHDALNDQQIQQAIENLQKIDLVGIQEHLDEFMGLLCTEFSWETKRKPRTNVNETNYGLDANNPLIVKALAPLYEKDLILYKEAKRIYQKQKALYCEPPTGKVLGAVETVTPKCISGWARFDSSRQKVELELRKDQKVVQTSTCNIYHEAQKLNGEHPTGYCGFRFTKRTWPGMKNCSVFVKGRDQRLLKNNSV